ncbi:MAG TPA: sulfite exporter TauE/SafE family protein [Chitinophagaceae bacterium]|nr:sulfite exporter TauE/SafE family protein [Chitinophagaceae bacterium]
MSAFLLSGFVLGLFGSMHCLGMCGPLVMSLPFQSVDRNKLGLTTFSYHVGKITTYALFGLVAGMLGQGFVLLKWQQLLSILAGVSLLALTLIPVLKEKLKISFPLQDWFARIFKLLSDSPKVYYFFIFGLINGLLPCGLVYAAFAGAMASGSMINGALFMAAFGVGTVPSLSAIIIFKQRVPVKIRSYFLKSSYILSIFVGVLLILRGLNLGIPYVSPGLNTATHEMDCCHKH